MLLAIDAGNTNVVFADYDGREIKARWRIATDPRAAASESRPPVWITTENYHPLASWVRRHHAQDAPLGDFLLGEISRAVVCAPEWIAPDVVTMCSQVLLQDTQTGQRNTLTLCYPADAEPAVGFVSVLSPVGSALLGLRVGSIARWSTPAGDEKAAEVLAILFQPEASGD